MLSMLMRWTILLCLVALFGCGMPMTDVEVRDTAEVKLLQDLIGKLETSDLLAVRSLLDGQMNSLPNIEKLLENSAQLLPNEKPKSVEFLNWWMNVGNTVGRTSGVSAQLEYTTQWVLVTANFAGQPELMKIAGFRVDQAKRLQDGTSPFTALTYATGPTYMLNIVIATITVVALLVGVAMCLLARGLKKKWLWTLFILFCTPAFYVEPAQGTYMFNFLNFGWADGSWFQPLSGLNIIVPLGAIVFLMKRWQQRKPLDGTEGSHL